MALVYQRKEETRLISVADPEAVKKFREDLTSLGTVYINDA